MVEGFISELIKTLKLFDGEEHVRLPRPGLFILSSLEQKMSGICVLWFYLQSEMFFSNFKIFSKCAWDVGLAIGVYEE